MLVCEIERLRQNTDAPQQENPELQVESGNKIRD